MSQYTANSIRTLVDKYFSLQWCRDNLVVPLGISPSLPPDPQTIKIAIGKEVEKPIQLNKMEDKIEKFDIIENSNSEAKNYILSKIQ